MNSQRNQFLKKILVEIIETFNKIAVEPILYKGSTSFFDNLFPDPGMRLMTDLDIIIKKNDLDRCLNALYKKGYQHDKAELERLAKLGDLYENGKLNYGIYCRFEWQKNN